MSHEETFIFCIFPAFRNFNFYNLFCTGIDSCPVFLNNVITFTSVSSFCSCFHQFDCLLFRNDSCKFEECRLKDCVDTCWSHASFNTDLNTVDCVEFDIVVSDKCFYLSRKPAALAAEQLLRANGKHYNYFLDGKPYVIGVNAESRSGKFYYCRQIESMTDYKVTETTTVENTEAARRLAWLLSEYQHDGEPVLTYAAIGVLVHRNYDDQKVWVRHEQYLFSVMDGLESKVNELWEEAANKLPVSSRVTRDDRQGLRSGSLFVQLLDSSGQPIEGVFTATIEGPAVFDEDDEPTAVGWAELEGTTVYWHATGAGEVNIKVGYQSVGLDEAVTAQKMMVLNDVVEREDSLLTFNVDNLYAPEQEMPQTGSPMGLVLGLAAAVMCCGAFMLYAVRRR